MGEARSFRDGFREQLRAGSPDSRAETIEQLHALMTCVEAMLCDAVVEADTARDWLPDGARHMAGWLSQRLGIGHHHAKRLAETATDLDALPAVADAFADGVFSFDQVRELVRFATPETEHDLVDECRGASVNQLAWMARMAENRSAADETDTHDERFLAIQRDCRANSVELRGRFFGKQAHVIASTLETMVAAVPRSELTGKWDSYAARQADALELVCLSELADHSEAARPTVVVHVSAERLAEQGPGFAHFELGHAISTKTARRLACDAYLRVAADDARGRTRAISSRARTVPAHMARVLLHRDGGCVFPGCGGTRFLEFHHTPPHAQTGRTRTDELVTLCNWHHDVVERPGWQIRGDPDDADTPVEFIQPNGHKAGTGPKPLDPDLKHQLRGPDTNNHA